MANMDDYIKGGIIGVGAFIGGCFIGACIGTSYAFPKCIYPSNKQYKERKCMVSETSSGLQYIFVEQNERFVPISELEEKSETEIQKEEKAKNEILQDVRNLKEKIK